MISATEVDQDEEEGEEEVPMLHLASFAIHKLFSEWQSEGFNIPDFKIGQPVTGNAFQPVTQIQDEIMSMPQSPPSGKSELPQNALDVHPTSLLCMVRHHHSGSVVNQI